MKKLIAVLVVLLAIGTLFLNLYHQKSPNNPTTDGPIVATIAPLQSLVQMITGDLHIIALLIPIKQSPHHFQIKPSDISSIKNAALIFRIGVQFETNLNKALKTHSQPANIVTMTQTPHINLLPARTVNRHHDEHAHHGAHDPHIWLHPQNAKHMLRFIAKKLGQQFSQHQAIYQANLKNALLAIDQLDQTITKQLAPFKSQPFVVFHDGYQYFEAHYQLNNQGVITDEGIPPSAQHLQTIQQTIETQSIQCILSEPQYNPKIIHTLATHQPIKTVTLDPIGVLVGPPKQRYATLMSNLAHNIKGCLSP